MATGEKSQKLIVLKLNTKLLGPLAGRPDGPIAMARRRLVGRSSTFS